MHHSESHWLCSGSRKISWGPQPKEWPDLTHIEVCLSLDGKIALMTTVKQWGELPTHRGIQVGCDEHLPGTLFS